MSEGWSTIAAKRLRDQAHSKQQEDSLVLQESTIRQEQGEHLWAEVRKHVTDKCAQMNTELQSNVAVVVPTQTSELKVRLTPPGGGSPRDLAVRFKSTSAPDALTWRTSGYRMNSPQDGEYGIYIERGTAFFGNAYTTPEEIAEAMLNALLLE
jgi:hypothetical protein